MILLCCMLNKNTSTDVFSDMTGMKLKTQGSSPKEKYNVYQVHTKILNRRSQALDVDARGKVTFGEPGGRIRSLGKIWWSQWTYQDVKKSYLFPNYDFWYPFLKISRLYDFFFPAALSYTQVLLPAESLGFSL